MTPLEKAEKIIHSFEDVDLLIDNELCIIGSDQDRKAAINCAIIAVDEIIQLANRSDLFKMRTKREHMSKSTVDETYVEYWDEVKREIGKYTFKN